MPNVVSVQFQKAGRLGYYASNQLDVEAGDRIVIQSKRGMGIGHIKFPLREVDVEGVTLSSRNIIRKMDEDNQEIHCRNERDANDALELCKKIVKDQQLDVRLVNCEYTLDKSRVAFNFIADDRIDSRKLVKVLAQNLKIRIELRQIGVRDEAKLSGGIGPCGRSLCCSTFLGNSELVSIKVAKDQNLSLNSTKISGAYGRLMCCPRYENDYYKEVRTQLSDVGDMTQAPNGHGKAIGLSILGTSMQVKIEGLE